MACFLCGFFFYVRERKHEKTWGRMGVFFFACDVIPSGGSFWVAVHSSEYKTMFAKEEPCPPFFDKDLSGFMYACLSFFYNMLFLFIFFLFSFSAPFPSCFEPVRLLLYVVTYRMSRLVSGRGEWERLGSWGSPETFHF